MKRDKIATSRVEKTTSSGEKLNSTIYINQTQLLLQQSYHHNHYKNYNRWIIKFIRFIWNANKIATSRVEKTTSSGEKLNSTSARVRRTRAWRGEPHDSVIHKSVHDARPFFRYRHFHRRGVEVTIPRPHDLIGTSWKRSSARWKGIGCVHPRRRLIGLYRLSATRAPFQLADRDVPINGGDVSTDCTGGTRRCGRPLQDFLPRARVHDKSGSFRNSKARR